MLPINKNDVGVVKLADTHALGACAARREGSSPSPDTKSAQQA